MNAYMTHLNPHTHEEDKVHLIYLVINYVNVLSPKKLVKTELRVW